MGISANQLSTNFTVYQVQSLPKAFFQEKFLCKFWFYIYSAWVTCHFIYQLWESLLTFSTCPLTFYLNSPQRLNWTPRLFQRALWYFDWEGTLKTVLVIFYQLISQNAKVIQVSRNRLSWLWNHSCPIFSSLAYLLIPINSANTLC